MPTCPTGSVETDGICIQTIEEVAVSVEESLVLAAEFSIEAWISDHDQLLLSGIGLHLYASNITIDTCTIDLPEADGWHSFGLKVVPGVYGSDVTVYRDGHILEQQSLICEYIDDGLSKYVNDDLDVVSDFLAYQFATPPRNVHHECNGDCHTCPMSRHCPASRTSRRLIGNCHASCLNCKRDNDELECLLCAPGFFSLAGYTLCRPTCPTGFPLDLAHTKCSNNTSSKLVDAFLFDRVQFDWEGRNFRLIGGIDPVIKDITDPLPAKDRGVYFDGRKKYFAMHPFELHVTFTLDSWLFAQQLKNLYSIVNQSGNQIFMVGIQGENVLRMFFNDQKRKEQIFNSYTIPGVRYELAWNLVTVALDYIDLNKQTSVNLYVNGLVGAQYTAQHAMFKDSWQYQHFIGKGEGSASFRGFIYMFKIYASSNLNFEDRINTEQTNCKGCVQCTETGCRSFCPPNQESCLSTCSFDQFPIGNSGVNCRRCKDECLDGCIGPADCSLCNDPQCHTCADFETCSECIDNAKFVQQDCQCLEFYEFIPQTAQCAGCMIKGCKKCPNKNFCEECFDNYFKMSNRKCIPCDQSCTTCVGQTSRDCLTCALGLVKQWQINVCLTACPTGLVLDEENSACNGETPVTYTIVLDSKEYEQHDLDYPFDLYGGDSEELTEVYDPTPIYKRGLWFDSSYISITDLMLNHSWTMHFWVNIHRDGTLFSIAHGGSLFVLKIINENVFVKYTNLIDYSKGKFRYKKWSLVTVNMEYMSKISTINMFINHALLGVISFDSVFQDSGEHLHLIGATMKGFNSKGDFITGFMYEFAIFPYVDKVTSRFIEVGKCGTNNCEECPMGTCVSTCKWDEYITEQGDCGPCLNECTEGCLHQYSCSQCRDEVCIKCGDWDSCDMCADHARIEDGVCLCQENHFYDAEESKCLSCPATCASCLHENMCTTCPEEFFLDQGMCFKCDPECKECFGAGIFSCSACTDGHYLQAHTSVCLDSCPSGMSSSGGVCAKTGFVDFTFEGFNYQKTSQNVELYAGDGKERGPDDPFIVFQRGLWFAGEQYLNLENLMLNHFFTAGFWLNVYKPGTLFSVNRSHDPNYDKFFFIRIEQEMRINVGLEEEDMKLDLGMLEKFHWKHLLVKVDWNMKIQTYQNMRLLGAIEVAFDNIIDRSVYQHAAGGQIGYLHRSYYYIGFIYQIHFSSDMGFDEYEMDHNSTCGKGYCLDCPEESCLIECEYSQYLDLGDMECHNCHESCAQGCLRAGDCNLCLTNRKCLVCEDFVGECFECIENASNVENCECDGPLEFSDDEGACIDCMYGCEKCTNRATCIKCEEGFFLSDWQTCIECDFACLECWAEDFMSCSVCREGYYLQYGLAICVDQCPTNMMGPNGQKCVGSNEPIVFKFDSEDYPHIVSTVTLIPRGDLRVYYNRGLYLDGDGYLELSNLVLHHTSTTQFWLRSLSDGHLLDIENVLLKLEYNIVILEILQNQKQMAYLHYFVWVHLAFVMSLEDFMIFENGEVKQKLDEGIVLIDDDINSHEVGTMLIGFIHELSFTQQKLMSFHIDDSRSCPPLHCEECPPGVCLLECENDEFYDGGSCEPCQRTCEHGCVRGSDCNTCLDELCISCRGFSECNTCTEHGITNEFGDCSCPEPYLKMENQCLKCEDGCETCMVDLRCSQCKPGYYLDFYECHPCHESCVLCKDETNLDCSECMPNYFLQTNGTACLPHCPTMLLSTTRECKKGVANSIEFKFDAKNYETQISGVNIIGGTTVQYEAMDPIIIYERGLWFDGFSLLTLENLVIDSTFTLEFWIRSLNGDGNLLTAGNVRFMLSQDKFCYQNNNELVEAGFVAEFTWMHLAYAIRHKITRIYVDGSLDTTQGISYEFLDLLGELHIVGSGYIGNLFEVILSTHTKAHYKNEMCTTGYCKTCPQSVCLIDCNWNEYLEEGQCLPCLDTCTQGCLRGSDCRSCISPTCQTCGKWDEDCSECIEGASQVVNDCVCTFPTIFSAEESRCISCISGCKMCADSTSCLECMQGYFLEDGFCKVCDPACKTCTDITNFCTVCQEGYFKHDDVDVCFDFCPSWLGHRNRKCIKTEETYSFRWHRTGDVNIKSHGITISPGENSTPMSVFLRGVYIKENDFYLVEGLIFNNSFTLEMWVLTNQPGNLFTIETLSNFGINDDWTIFFDDVSEGIVTSNSWAHIIVCVTGKRIAMYKNQKSFGKKYLQDYVIDQPNFGHKMATGGFVGYYYKITYSNYGHANFEPYQSCGVGYCDFCPQTVCLIECEPLEYLSEEDGSCQPCQPGCTEGCLKGSDCVMCMDILCKECSSYDKCSTCVENAALSSRTNTCTCIPPYIFSNVTSTCVTCIEGCDECLNAETCVACAYGHFLTAEKTCQKCHENCEICLDETNMKCQKCATGNYIQHKSNICLPFCPSGYHSSKTKCIDSDTEKKVDFESGSFVGGDFGFEGDFRQPPLPIYKRGLWFESCSLAMTELVLSHTFTMHFWIYINDYGTLFSVTRNHYQMLGDEDFIDLSILGDQFSFMFSEGIDSVAETTAPGADPNVWLLLTMSMLWTDGKGSNLEIYVNNKLATADVFGPPVIDMPEYMHVLGSELDFRKKALNYFRGFIFIVTYVAKHGYLDQSVNSCGPGYCQHCPDKHCLIECVKDEWLEDDHCAPCQAHCTEGCIRGTDCKNCSDPLCKKCEQPETCDVCVQRALKETHWGCKCEETHIYSEEEDQCVKCMDGCQACSSTDTCDRCLHGYFLTTNNHCQRCHYACKTCFDQTVFICPSCAPNHIKQFDSEICLGHCPTGFTILKSECSQSNVFEHTFDFMASWTNFDAKNNDISLHRASGHPFFAYQRGMWLNGHSDMVIQGIILNHSFTFESWMRPSASGTVFSVGRTNIFLLQINADNNIRVVISNLADIIENVVELHIWMALQVTTEWIYDNTQIQLYKNGRNEDAVQLPVPILDSEEEPHIIGSENQDRYIASSFANITIGNFVKRKFPIAPSSGDYCGAGYCEECPVCYINCSGDEYMEDGDCKPCNKSCLTGCLRGSDCRPCEDPKCYDCGEYGECQSCIKFASIVDGSCTCTPPHTYSDTEGVCTKCAEGCKECVIFDDCTNCSDAYYMGPQGGCLPCDEACAKCVAADECLECKEGQYMQFGHPFCLSFCPTGLNLDDTHCISPHMLSVEFNSLEYEGGDFGIRSGLSEGRDDGDPTPIYERGLWFDGNDYLSMQNFLMNSSFSITMWVRPIGNGQMLFNENLIDLRNSNGNLTIVAMKMPAVKESARWDQLHRWNYISINGEHNGVFTNMTAKHNTKNLPAARIPNMFIDSPFYAHLLGAQKVGGVLSNFFIGFIQYLSISPLAPQSTQNNQNFSFCGDGYCDFCPASSCLSICAWNEYNEDGLCKSCDDTCYGCLRQTDCKMNFDELCEDWSDYKECDTCIEHAEKDFEGLCQCKYPYFYAKGKCVVCIDNCTMCSNDTTCDVCVEGFSVDKYGRCDICALECVACQDKTNLRCETCAPGYVTQARSMICLPYCPSGFIKTSLCTEDRKKFDLIFDAINYEGGDLNITGGSSLVEEGSDPMSIFKRGLWFGGDDYLTMQNLTLNHSFTLNIWVRIEDDGTLFSITPSEIDTKHVGFLTVRSVDDGNLSIELQDGTKYTSLGVYNYRTWVNLGMTLLWEQIRTDVNFYANNNQIGDFEYQGAVIDVPSYTHIIGAELDYRQNRKEFFIGFIYSIEFLQYVEPFYSQQYKFNCGPGHCVDGCPQTTCLIECNWNEFLSDGYCDMCMGGCESGCIRQYNCRQCLDAECASCDNDYNSCDSCIEGASFQGKMCVCNSPSFYSEPLDKCIHCDPHCEECNDLGDCAACYHGFYLENNVCYKCDETCFECISQARCTLCERNFLLHQQVGKCKSFCPTGLDSENGGVCANIPDFMIMLRFDRDMNDISGLLLNSPEQRFERGLWFSGEDTVQIEYLSLNYSFTITLWLWYDQISDLFSVSTEDKTTLLVISIENVYINNKDIMFKMAKHEWTHFAITANPAVQILLNGSLWTTAEFFDFPLYDEPNNHHVIGGDFNDLPNRFQGYIFEFIYIPSVVSNFGIQAGCGLGRCTNCPDVCLTSCMPDEFLDGGECKKCDESCESGCLRENSCSLCIDPACGDCDNYLTCHSCVENAEFNAHNLCECIPPAIFSKKSGQCEGCRAGCLTCSDGQTCDTCEPGWFMDKQDICVKCSESCNECYDVSNFQCIDCAEGFYMLADTTVCMEVCPSGFIPNEGQCTGGNEYTITFNLDYVDGAVPDLFKLTGHSSTDFEYYPMYVADRGLFFSGKTYIPLKNHVLHHTFTIDMWVRVEDNGNLFSICRDLYQAPQDQKLLNFRTNFGKNLFFQYAEGRNSIINMSAGDVEYNHWQQVAVSVAWNTGTGESSATLYINGKSLENKEFYRIIIDTPNFTHTIGAEMNVFEKYVENFIGYIYEFNVYPYVQPVMALGHNCEDPYCSICPPQTCVLDCDWFYYVDETTHTCESCHADCKQGCVRSTDCRLCHDQLCQDCKHPDTCDTCIDNADIVNGSCVCIAPYTWSPEEDMCILCSDNCTVCNRSNNCVECEEGYFVSSDARCFPCDSSCTKCENDSNWACQACSDGYYLQVEQEMCLTYCLEGKMTIENTCQIIPDDQNQVQTFLSKVYDGGIFGIKLVGTSPALLRGIWFGGNGYLQLTNLHESHAFCHQFWVNIHSNGPLFSSADSQTMIAIDEGKLKYEVPGFTIKSNHRVPEIQWSYVAVVAKFNSKVGIYVDGQQDAIDNLPVEIEISQNGLAWVGTDSFTSGFYTGFLYMIGYAQAAHVELLVDQGSCDAGYCQVCPPGVCLMDCDITSVAGTPLRVPLKGEPSACLPCDSSCTEGCIRTSDCKLCVDQLCATCTDYNTCDECVEGANFNEHQQCRCEHANDYSLEEDRCIGCIEGCEKCTNSYTCQSCYLGYYLDGEHICQPCSEGCHNCQNQYICHECSIGFLMQLNSKICLPFCPSGFSESDGQCQIEEEIACITLDSHKYEKEYPGFEIFAGKTRDSFVDDPTLIFGRGQWFDGVDDFITLENLILNQSFSVQFWARPETGGDVFSVNRPPSNDGQEEIVLNFVIMEKFLTFLYNHGGNPKALVGTMQIKMWQMFSMYCDFEPHQSHLKLYVDTKLLKSDLIDEAIVDEPDYIHLIGAELDSNGQTIMHYKGFLYELCIYSFAIAPHTEKDQCPANHCHHCPINGECLIDCDWDHVLENGECVPCPSRCPLGCIRSTDCGHCNDQMCSECEDFDSCTSCIENAILTENGCECIENLYFNTKMTICERCSEHCLECTDHDPRNCMRCVGIEILGICYSQLPTGMHSEKDLEKIVFQLKIQENIPKFDSIANMQIEGSGLPMLSRGIYFSEGSFIWIKDFITYHTFTMSFWVKAEKYTNLVNFMTRYGQITVTDNLRVLVSYFEETGTFSSDVELENKWNLIALTCSYENSISNFQLLLNQQEEGTLAFNGLIGSDIDDIFLVGADQALTNSFTGFLYSVEVYNYAKQAYHEVQFCGDHFSPSDICLSSCSKDEFPGEDGTCETCRSDCVNGCVRTENCNLCKDEMCLMCQSFSSDCEYCIEFALKNSDDECQCADAYIYDKNLHSCVKTCHVGCFDCVERDNQFACLECNDGWFMQDGATTCLNFCPFGYNEWNNECVLKERTSLVVEFSSKRLDVVTRGDPQLIYGRGLSLEGINSYIEHQDLLIHHTFTFVAWVRVSNPGYLLDTGIFSLQLALDSVEVSYNEQPQTADGLDISKWSAISIEATVDNVKLLFNGALILTATYMTPIADVAETITLIGASTTLDNFLGGLIYSYTYSLTPVSVEISLDECDAGHCSICPSNSGYPVCLIDCNWNEILDEGGECSNCPQNCACANYENCNGCTNKYCENCEDDWAVCKTCGSSTQLVAGDCKCEGAFIDTNCFRCPYECDDCTDRKQNACTGCKEDFYLFDGFCVTVCPSLSTKLHGKCNKPFESELFAFKYTQLTSALHSKQYMTILGHDHDFLCEDSSPIPILNRGLYFDGSSWAQILESNEHISPVLANNWFSNFWIRLETQELTCLFSKTDTFEIYLSPTRVEVSVQVKTLDIISDEEMRNLQGDINGMKLDSWQKLVVATKFEHDTITVLFRNTESELTRFTLEDLHFIDYSLENQFILGCGDRNCFIGNIAEFSLSNFENQNTLSSHSIFSTCESNEWISGSSCRPCPGNCECYDACLRASDCKLNTDPLCATFTTFDRCDTCVELAHFEGGNCICAPFSQYIPAKDACQCIEGYGLSSLNSCELCNAYLVPHEIHATYLASYQGFTVAFIKEIAIDALNTCEDIFVDTSALGEGATCEWNESHYLKVTFGHGSVFPEDVLVIRNDRVFAKNEACSHEKSYLPIEIREETPYPVPDVTIISPKSFSIRCDDLVLAVDVRSGDIGRAVQHKWTFSIPQFKHFGDFAADNAEIHLGNVFDPKTTLEVSVYTKNYFGQVGSATATVSILGYDAFQLDIEGDTEIYRNARNTFNVSTHAECGGNSNFVYTWGNSNGEFFQTQIFTIEAHTLEADEEYKYSVKAYDPVLEATVIDFVSIYVIGSPLVALIDQPSGQISYIHGIYLDGSSSYDPDDSNTPMEYLWSCDQCLDHNGNPLLQDIDATSPKLTLLMDKAPVGATYTITLTVSKPHRSGSTSVTLDIVPDIGPDIRIVPISARVSSQKDIRLKAYTHKDQETSWYWEDVGNEKVEYKQQGMNYPWLVIDGESLKPGTSYQFQLEFWDPEQIETKLRRSLQFTTNRPPTSGGLSISPAQGMAYKTEFLMTANDWETEDLPLEYRLSYSIEDQRSKILSDFDYMPEVSTLLCSGFLTIHLQVCDFLGTCSSIEKSIEVSPGHDGDFHHESDAPVTILPTSQAISNDELDLIFEKVDPSHIELGLATIETLLDHKEVYQEETRVYDALAQLKPSDTESLSHIENIMSRLNVTSNLEHYGKTVESLCNEFLLDSMPEEVGFKGENLLFARKLGAELKHDVVEGNRIVLEFSETESAIKDNESYDVCASQYIGNGVNLINVGVVNSGEYKKGHIIASETKRLLHLNDPITITSFVENLIVPELNTLECDMRVNQEWQGSHCEVDEYNENLFKLQTVEFGMMKLRFVEPIIAPKAEEEEKEEEETKQEHQEEKHEDEYKEEYHEIKTPIKTKSDEMTVIEIETCTESLSPIVSFSVIILICVVVAGIAMNYDRKLRGNYVAVKQEDDSPQAAGTGLASRVRDSHLVFSMFKLRQPKINKATILVVVICLQYMLIGVLLENVVDSVVLAVLIAMVCVAPVGMGLRFMLNSSKGAGLGVSFIFWACSFAAIPVALGMCDADKAFYWSLSPLVISITELLVVQTLIALCGIFKD